MARLQIRRAAAAAWVPAVLGLLVLAVALPATWFGGPALDRTVIQSLINVMLVVGLYSFVGVSGVFSFGHMSFMAVGAYATALLTIPAVVKPFQLPDLPGFIQSAELGLLPAALIGGAMAALFAAILAPALMRLSGLTASLATVALLIIVRNVAQNAESITQGTSGLAGIPTNTTLQTVLIWSLAAIAVVWVFQRSRTGLRLQASREDEIAARSVGIDVMRERTLAFLLSAFIVGVAGGLFAQSIGSVTPEQFYISITFVIIAMLVIGGATSLTGAVVGAVGISVVTEILRRVEDGVDLGVVSVPGRQGVAQVGLALILLLVLMLRPAGITGGRELPLPRWLRSAPRERAEAERPVGGDTRDQDPVTAAIGESVPERGRQ